MVIVLVVEKFIQIVVAVGVVVVVVVVVVSSLVRLLRSSSRRFVDVETVLVATVHVVVVTII